MAPQAKRAAFPRVCLRAGSSTGRHRRPMGVDPEVKSQRIGVPSQQQKRCLVREPKYGHPSDGMILGDWQVLDAAYFCTPRVEMGSALSLRGSRPGRVRACRPPWYWSTLRASDAPTLCSTKE